MNLAKEAPELAATSTHSALNLGMLAAPFSAAGRLLTPACTSLPWIGAGLTGAGFVLMLWSYLKERRF